MILLFIIVTVYDKKEINIRSFKKKRKFRLLDFLANIARICANNETRDFRMIFHTGSRNDRPSFESPRERRIKDTTERPRVSATRVILADHKSLM